MINIGQKGTIKVDLCVVSNIIYRIFVPMQYFMKSRLKFFKLSKLIQVIQTIFDLIYVFVVVYFYIYIFVVVVVLL